MSWIDVVSPSDATGKLRRLYDSAIERAGMVYKVIMAQSLQPTVLQASTNLYTRVMVAPDEPLTRAQREMLAVTVSRINACEY